MKSEGYITDENGNTHSTPESKKPFDIFTRTIRGFYPNTNDEQLEAAWELFIYHMERQGNIAKTNRVEDEEHNKSKE